METLQSAETMQCMKPEKTDIKSLQIKDLECFTENLGEKKFRAAQIYEWLHRHKCQSFDEMTNLSEKLRNELKQKAHMTQLVQEVCKASAQDETKKFLFRLEDGQMIESVLMRYHHGYTVCVSSQAGCRMGCRFCASTIGGLYRNLLPSEMLEEVYEIERLTGVCVSHVVVMGTGEPFDNYDNLVAFIRLLISEQGHNISVRNITVSTCGLVEGIDRFCKEELPVTLALSLHAPNDTVRKQLMPVANRYSIQEVLGACERYYEKTGRRITYEYSLVHTVNDTKECAKELSKLLKNRNCHVNLIPVNPVKERTYQRTTPAHVLEFKNILEKNRINVTIRREMGTDIDAACGQLRRSYEEQQIES